MSKSPIQSNHERWLKEAKRQKAKWILDVCDTWDYTNYPVYIKTKKQLEEARQKYNGQNMQQIDAEIEVNPKKKKS